MAEPHQPRIPGSARESDPAARAASGRPFRPYAYNGGEIEPAAVTAARQRHRAVNAKIEAARAALDARLKAGEDDG